MKHPPGSLTTKMKTLLWAVQTAWKINSHLLLTWFLFSAVLAVLPAVSLGYSREAVARLSAFITGGTGSFEDILPTIIKLGLILMLIGLSTHLNLNYVQNMMQESYHYGMQELLMDSIQRFDIPDLLGSDVNEEFNFIVRRSNSLNTLISSACVLGGKIVAVASLLIVAWAMSRPVFFLTLVFVVAVFALNVSFAESTRYNHAQYRKAEVKASYLEKMPEEKGMAKEIRVYNCGEDVIRSWQKAYARVLDLDLKRYSATERRNFLSGLVFYLFLVLVVVYSLFEVAGGRIGPDVFLLIYTLCLNLSAVISTLARDLLSFDEGLFSVERQMNLLKLTPGKKEEQDQSLPPLNEEVVFQAENLSFHYGSGKPAVDGVSFTVKQGEIMALVGANGSGKSTLTKLLIGLYKPTGGRLYFCGRSYAAYPPAYLNQKIGMFFQDYYLFHHLLSENVAYGDIGSIMDENKIREAVQKSGVSRFLAKLPGGLHTLLGKNVDKSGTELSGGEKQQVAIARAHMNNKDVIIFDEPAAMLDPLAEIEQFHNIRDKINHKTAVLISHRIGFARLADRILMMQEGRIAEMGTHEELMARNGLYAAFFREQSQWYTTENSPALGKAVRP